MRSSTAGVRPSSWTLFRDQRDQVAPGDEMLYGANAIAKFLFGDERYRRRVYHLAEKGRLPVARIPGFAARKSTLRDWLSHQEHMSICAPHQEAA